LVRVGLGTDSHAFEEDGTKPLVLGGVKLSECDGLKARSDGDVVLHALFNAISQACGGESIGYYADEMCDRGIMDSREYLKRALEMVRGMGYRINNIGIMVEAKRPCVAVEDSRRMKRSIARLAEISDAEVGITYTSGEELTSFGRGEGVYVQAVVSIVKA
jgi:2-C-methyl-D-erythritol 2,4-cyclodiphosphate synthase